MPTMSEATSLIASERELLERLKNKSITNENGCWLYQGGQDNDGHCIITYNHRQYGIHRLSLYIFKDFDLNSKFFALHKPECSNPNCWNPEHLYEGTALDNNLDINRTGNNFHSNKTHCKQGHEFTEENTYIDKYGWRNCRECARLKSENRRKKLGEIVKGMQ